MSYFFAGFAQILSDPQYLMFMFAGVALGMVLGCLPGLTGSLGIALMLPFTYHMEALTALVFLGALPTAFWNGVMNSGILPWGNLVIGTGILLILAFSRKSKKTSKKCLTNEV